MLERTYQRWICRGHSQGSGWSSFCGGLLIRAVALSVAVPGVASAAGTNAGTVIESNATVTYTSGSFTGSISSNTASVRVDELLNLAVAIPAPNTVLPGQVTTPLTFVITNTGNGPEPVILRGVSTLAGSEFDITVERVVIDSNGNGAYDPGIDEELPAATQTPAILPDSSLKLFVLARMPSQTRDGQSSNFRLTVAAATGTGAPGTILANKGEGGSDAVIGISGGEGSATVSLVASLATVTLTKSATVRDQYGGSQPIPGATISYRLAAAVAGSGQVQDLVLSDSVPAGASYVPGSLKLDDVALTDAADGDAGSGGPAGIAAKIPTVAAGTTRVVSFDVKIN